MKFLVYAGPGIGDAMLVLPLARAIKSHFENATVDLLISSTKAKAELNNRLVACLPYLDGLESYSSSEKIHCAALVAKLRARHYDYGLVAQYEINEGTSPWPCKIMRMAGMETVGLGSCRSDIHYDHEIAACPGKHKSQIALSLLVPLGVTGSYAGEPLLAAADYGRHANGLGLPDGGFVALVAGCGPVPYREKGVSYTSNNKDWGIDNWISLAEELISSKKKVVLLGGKRESDEVARRKLPLSLICLCGKTSIEESMGVVAKAECLASADTGLMHCAGAMGVPTVSLFGCTDPREYAPSGANSLCVSAGVPCSPCFGTKRSVVCTERKCMSGISPDDIADKISNIIRRKL